MQPHRQVTIQQACDDFLAVVCAESQALSLDELIHEVKYSVILHVLKRNHGKQSSTAKDLDIHRNTLAKLVQQMKIAGRDLSMIKKRAARKRSSVITGKNSA